MAANPVLQTSLALLFTELIDGPPTREAYMLNPGDAGLLRSLDHVAADEASKPPAPGAATIAAHVNHLSYGLELMNRWSDGDPNPFASSDWAASWRRGAVTEEEWDALRTRLRAAAARWREALAKPRELSAPELNGMISSIAHLAYHFGAIRQIDRASQGPKAE